MLAPAHERGNLVPRVMQSGFFFAASSLSVPRSIVQRSEPREMSVPPAAQPGIGESAAAGRLSDHQALLFSPRVRLEWAKQDYGKNSKQRHLLKDD